MVHKASVIGAGSWGTTLADQLGQRGLTTTLWCRRPALAQSIEAHRENREYLRGHRINERVNATGALDEALEDAEFVVLAVPAQSVRSLCKTLAPCLPAASILCTAIKGIDQQSLQTISQILQSELPQVQPNRCAFLGGPSFAREVALGVPTAVVVASTAEATARRTQQTLHSNRFRVYRTEDVIGVELGGALKNVIAIGVGIADGLGLGHNARAALITRGLAEITRLATAMGADPLTLSGLAGMGDLVLTCTGDLSRNRTVGFALGSGKQLEETLKSVHMVAEGVQTAKSATQLARRMNVQTPIIDEVYLVLHEGKSPEEALHDLIARPPKAERPVPPSQESKSGP